MRWREISIVGLLGLALALLWTWPLALHAETHLPFDPRFTTFRGSDTHQYVWNLWWARLAIESGRNPFWCDLIFWPHGHGLALHTHAFFWGLLSIPLQWVAGLPFALNAVLVLLPAAAFTATWALLRALGLSRGACALGAFAWAFSPYFQQKGLEHLSYAASPWPPLFLLSLLLWRAAPGGWRAWLAPAACAGLVLGLSVLCDAVASFYLGISGAVFLVCNPQSADRGPARARRTLLLPAAVLVCAGMALVAGSTYFAELWRELCALAGQTQAARSLGREQLYHPQLSDFLTPSGLHPWCAGLGAGAPAVGASWSGARPESSALYLGLAPLALALVGSLLSSPSRRWLCASFLLLVLCWDPGPDPQGWISGWYRSVPGLDALRVPARCFPVAFLPLCTAAAMGFDGLRGSRAGRGAAAALGLLLPFEFWCGPVPLERLELPQAASAIARLDDDRAVCVLPFMPGSYVSMSWQSVHAKPVTWSYVARLDTTLILEMQERAPQLYAFATAAREPDPIELAMELERLGVGHILVPAVEVREPELPGSVLDRMTGWERVPLVGDVLWWRRRP